MIPQCWNDLVARARDHQGTNITRIRSRRNLAHATGTSQFLLCLKANAVRSEVHHDESDANSCRGILSTLVEREMQP